MDVTKVKKCISFYFKSSGTLLEDPLLNGPDGTHVKERSDGDKTAQSFRLAFLLIYDI